MIKKIDNSTLELDNKGIEDIFFTEAYDTFLMYLKEQSIECFKYVDHNNSDPKKAAISEIPVKEYSMNYIYADLYMQKEKDIVDLFGRIIKLNCKELNHIRSANQFLNDLCESNIVAGKPRLYNFSIIFELDYLKISCEDGLFMLLVRDHKIIISLDKHNVTIDRTSCDISKQFKDYVIYSMSEIKKDISRLFEGKDVDAVYICNRMNKSLIDIYMEQQFKGLTIKCPYKLVTDNGFKNNVNKSKYGNISYTTSIYKEAIILVNNYLEKNYAKKCTQLINLIYFMNSIEKTQWSLRLQIKNDSKCRIQYEDVLEILLIYGDSKIKINLSGEDYFFTSFYGIKNEIFKQDNDLNSLYMYILNKFEKRILKACEFDGNTILKEHLDIYRMCII